MGRKVLWSDPDKKGQEFSDALKGDRALRRLGDAWKICSHLLSEAQKEPVFFDAQFDFIQGVDFISFHNSMEAQKEHNLVQNVDFITFHNSMKAERCMIISGP